VFDLPRDGGLHCRPGEGHRLPTDYLHDRAAGRETNPRLIGKIRDPFVDLMNSLDLHDPKKFAETDPVNRHDGAG
jgi:hypothetical protein